MLAAKLHAAEDIRVETISETPPPAPHHVQIKVGTVGVCGSDLHTYKDGRIGDTTVSSPVILGHEFSGVVTQIGEGALDAHGNRLKVGQLVAVDPAVPCWRCEVCERGDPNLCPNHYFYGLFPEDGALQEFMNVDARSCFPVPDGLNSAVATLLEPLGVAIHALDLGKVKLADTVAVIGCGPIGLKTVKLAKLAGAHRVFGFDLYDWRAKESLEWGADDAFCLADGDSAQFLNKATGGAGADVVFEVAWADQSVQQAADMAALGARIVLVGIPEDDQLSLQHSTARRKGLSLILARRMKHTYPRAIKLAERLELERLVTHTFPLKETPVAYATTAAYEQGLIKTIIEM